MSTLPSQTVTDLQRQAAADVSSLLLADFGVNALYKPVGSTEWASTPVRVYVGAEPHRNVPVGQSARNVGGAGMTGMGSTHRRSRFVLVAPALGPDETFTPGDAVGADGGVVHLREGDLFKVPGWVVERPEDVDGVDVRVGAGVQRPGGAGHWNGTVSS
jgi:hypothetical protein